MRRDVTYRVDVTSMTRAHTCFCYWLPRERRRNNYASNVTVHTAHRHNTGLFHTSQNRKHPPQTLHALKTRRDWCSYQLMCIKCALTQTIRAPRLPTFIGCSSELGLIDIAGMNGSQLVCNL